MKLIKNLILAIVLILAVLAVGISAFASTPDRMIGDARALVAQADQAEKQNRPAERDRLLDDAIKSYNRVVKEYGKSVEAPQALLLTAEARERMGITEKERNKNQHAALQIYKRIETQYGLPRMKLEERYGADARLIQQVASQAEHRHAVLAEEIDERNSGHALYRLLDFFVNLTGRKPAMSYWLAIVIITLIVKILITPLTKAQFKSMREMQRIQPLVKQIQEKYKGNQKELGEKVMTLYKEHGINPFAGCLPLLVQLPIMYFLYYMIRLYEFQFAKGTFLWISPALGQRVDWIGINLAQPDIPLVVLYTISMIISMRLSNVDPTQAQQQKMMSIYMPILFAFLFKSFPAAFLLYWLVFNILTTVQQYHIIHGKQAPVPATVPAQEVAPGGNETPKPEAPKPATAGARRSGPSGVRPRSRRRRR